MELLEPTDAAVAKLVRKEIKLKVETPDGFERYSANGSTTLFSDKCAIVVIPITPEFASRCEELHAAGGTKGKKEKFGPHAVTRYDSPGNKVLCYLAVNGVDLQVTVDPADSPFGLESLRQVIESVQVFKKSPN